MSILRLLPALVLAACCTLPALAQAPARTPSLAARMTALEKENEQLRADVAHLQALLTQTRREMITMEGATVAGTSAYVGGAGTAMIRPQSLSEQQAQTSTAIQNQGVNQQLNNLQLQQNMAQDRAREQNLFQPAAPFGTP